MTQAIGPTGWTRAYLYAGLSVVLLGLYTIAEPFGRDQGIHATIAFAWGEGLTTYRDVYNIKPPLTTLMHHLSQAAFGTHMQAIRLWDLGFVLLAVLGLVRVMQRLGRSPAEAGFSGLGFALIYYALTYWEHAQTDGWAGMTVIPSLLCLLAGWDRSGWPRVLWMLAGGAVLAVGVGFKYTVAASGLLVFLPLVAGGAAVRFHLSDLLAYVLGGACVLGLIGVSLHLAGALVPFLEIQDYIRGYIAYGSQAPGILREVVAILTPSPVMAWITVLGLLPWLAALMRGESLFVYSLLVWGLTAFLSGHVQGKGFAYHFMPLIPVYAILWGLFLAALHGALVRRLVGPATARALIALGLAWVIVSTPIWGRSIKSLSLWLRQAPLTDYHAIHPMPPDFDIVDTEAFAARLAAHRAPEDGLFVWGYETMLYLLVGEPPRYRYPYAWPFVVDFHDGRYTGDLMTRLVSDPPRHIVVQHGDGTPWVTGRPESSAEYLEQFPVLDAFIQGGYTEIDRTERFRLLERRD
ncbi:hypothetical protein OB2597_05515 [Pseudooceanicola batsensis HTCC2597]|uniref:Glycosyltransferase RgtA/B/C/D-like domain-containing protein n=1 Tax=Pseudooceanicola batsensis (strain ATCC BAA-863 / DSM 15984 / KCTC 12145 / HTCC2597) TaxID=252305 RepID=A3TST8_PSEBH|nr:hypothetical protein [Pseudooceanicola batsensis]EAQ04715.1 hypothetical protein OB2597_05515 [Pseudooceanicola batsensis HTCC2597]